MHPVVVVLQVDRDVLVRRMNRPEEEEEEQQRNSGRIIIWPTMWST